MLNRFLLSICLIAGIFIVSCYVEDSSPDTDLPLPFSSLTEYFADNRATVATFSNNTDAEQMITTDSGTVVTIPGMAFDGEVDIQLQDVQQKSALVLRGISTQHNEDWLDLGGAIFMEAIKNNQSQSVGEALSYKFTLSNDLVAPEELKFYYHSNDTWLLDEAVALAVNIDDFTYATDRKRWTCGARVWASDTNELQVSGYGYGEGLSDLKAFVVLENYTTVLEMEADANTVTASLVKAPRGESIKIVLIGMTNTQLFAGIANQTISEDTSLDIRLERVTTQSIIEMLATLD